MQNSVDLWILISVNNKGISIRKKTRNWTHNPADLWIFRNKKIQEGKVTVPKRCGFVEFPYGLI